MQIKKIKVTKLDKKYIVGNTFVCISVVLATAKSPTLSIYYSSRNV
jgi:hypothetical protein